MRHASGLEVEGAEDLAVLADPKELVLTTTAGWDGYGDVDIDGHNFGWYSMQDAQVFARHFGIPCTEQTKQAYKPKNPRRGLA